VMVGFFVGEGLQVSVCVLAEFRMGHP